MKILVTGHAGFLGSHLCDALLKDGHAVVGVDSLIGGDLKNVPKGVDSHIGDCGDADLMDFLTKDIDVIYHLACTPHEGLSVFSPITVTDSVFASSVVIGAVASRNKVKRVVFASSMARYGAQNAPFSEDMAPKPVDPYGIAKVASEDVLKALGETHGFQVNIAVPHNIYGARQKYDDPFRNVIGIMMNKLLHGEAPIIYGDGLQVRCFSYVHDIIPCLLKLGLDESIHGVTVNIGPDQGEITIKDLAYKIISISGVDCDPVFVEDRPREVKHATCSAEKSRSLLGFEDKTSLDVGLSDMWSWVKFCGKKPFQYHLPLEIINEKTPKTWLKRMF